MKKTLFSLALISVLGFGGLKAEAADSNLLFGYSGDIGTNIGVQAANTKLGGAMYIPADVAAQWSKAKISGLKIGYGGGNARTVTTFITNKLGSQPIYSQDANMNANVWNTVRFNTPQDVPAEGFYIGYEVTTKSAEDYPLGIDLINTPVDKGGYIAINGSWSNYSTQYGSVCLKVMVDGQDLPDNDLYILGSLSLSPYVGQNAEFPVTVSVTNNGSKAIESASASFTFNGESGENAIAGVISPASIPPGEFGTVTFNGVVYAEKNDNLKVDININTVNGATDANPSSNLGSGTTKVISEAFPRKFVVEEWTGTWCGNCPAGIVGMSHMQEKYGNENFIGIAVHGGSNTEPMLTTSYNGFISTFGNGGYPGCIINRDKQLVIYPTADALEYYYLNTQSDLTFANVEITDIDLSDVANGKISVTSNTHFSISNSNARYRMAYVLIEDHVGPYYQSNYFAGGNMGPLDGWEKKGSQVEWYFDEVARYINSSLGINNSIPTSITDGGEYEFTCELPITNVSNLANCHVVALLLNSSTGQIENAVKVKVPGESGVESIDADNDVKVIAGKGELRIFGEYRNIRVYSLSGQQVASSGNVNRLPLDKGLYIYSVTRTDGSTVNGKILIH